MQMNSILQRRQSGSKNGGRESGLENWGWWVLKFQQKEARSAGFKVSSRDFYLYTQICLSNKSPLWKVFSSHISVHALYDVTVFHVDPAIPTTPHPKILGLRPPTLRIDVYIMQ